MIRVLLADDQQLIREALAALLGLEVDLEIVGQVGSGDEVLGAVALLKPDVVLLDVQMPGTLLTDGIEAAAAIRDAGALSESGEPVRTLIVTTFGRPGYVRRALEAGASGFVVKDTGARQLAEAIRRVYAGLRVVDPSLAADSLVTGASPLTEREAQVLREAASGGTAQQIASALFLSAGTVRNYLSAAMANGCVDSSGCGAYRHGERLALACSSLNSGGGAVALPRFAFTFLSISRGGVHPAPGAAPARTR